MNVDDAVMFMISSADDKAISETDHFDTVKNKRDENVFRSEVFSIVCRDCQARGIKTGCTHMASRKPPWISKRKIDEIEAIMERRPDDFARENLGILTNNTNTLFDKEAIRRLFSPEHRVDPVDYSIEFVYMFIDPCGGIKNQAKPNSSDFAIVSAYYHGTGIDNGLNDSLIITGLDSIPTMFVTDYRGRVLEHCHRLRKIPGLANAKLIIGWENNANLEAGWMEEYLQNHGVDVYKWMKDRDLALGVETSSPVKRDMVVLMQQMLLRYRSLEAGAGIRISSKLFTTGDIGVNQYKLSELEQLLETQLASYMAHMTRAKTNDPGASVHYSYHAKHQGKDDLATAALLLAYWSRKHLTSANFITGTGSTVHGVDYDPARKRVRRAFKHLDKQYI